MTRAIYPDTYEELVQQQRDYDAYMQSHWDTRNLGIEWQIIAIIFTFVSVSMLSVVALVFALLHFYG